MVSQIITKKMTGFSQISLNHYKIYDLTVKNNLTDKNNFIAAAVKAVSTQL